MTPVLLRRRAVLGPLGLLLVGAATTRHSKAQKFRSSPEARALAMRVEGLLDSTGELEMLNRLCADAEQGPPSVQELVDQLFAQHAIADVSLWSDVRIRQWLASRVDSDFSRGQSVNLRGFLLSKTEALLGTVRLALLAEAKLAL